MQVCDVQVGCDGKDHHTTRDQQEGQYNIGCLRDGRYPAQINHRSQQHYAYPKQPQTVRVHGINQPPHAQQFQGRTHNQNEQPAPAQQAIIPHLPPGNGESCCNAGQDQTAGRKEQEPYASPVGGLAAKQDIAEQSQQQRGRQPGIFTFHESCPLLPAGTRCCAQSRLSRWPGQAASAGKDNRIRKARCRRPSPKSSWRCRPARGHQEAR